MRASARDPMVATFTVPDARDLHEAALGLRYLAVVRTLRVAAGLAVAGLARLLAVLGLAVTGLARLLAVLRLAVARLTRLATLTGLLTVTRLTALARLLAVLTRLTRLPRRCRTGVAVRVLSGALGALSIGRLPTGRARSLVPAVLRSGARGYVLVAHDGPFVTVHPRLLGKG